MEATRDNRLTTGNPFETLTAVAAEAGSAGVDPAPALRRLGDAGTVDRLLRAVLVAAMRRGPEADREEWGPARLLSVAARAARTGAVPARTAAGLRGMLEQAEERIRRDGVWDPQVPLWWRPLPEPEELEALWRTLDRPGASPYGSGGQVAESLRALGELDGILHAADGPGWLHLPDALGASLAGRIHRELTDAVRDGTLQLARGGVGSYDLSSPARTDRVVYVTGLEPELLAAAPATAVLVQWLLTRLTDLLPEGLEAPASAMLARYRAPSRGFVPHLDNPGGDDDNGRAITLVTYLTAPQVPCVGGEIAVWTPVGSSRQTATAAEPDVLPPTGGSMVVFDARRVLHEVRPLEPGPDRWTLVTWLSDVPRPRAVTVEPPIPSPAEILEPLTGVPLPAGGVLFRGVDLPSVGRAEEAANDGATSGSGLTVFAAPAAEDGREVAPRCGIVCTTDRAGAELERWCRHHLELGFDRLVVALDEASEPGTAAAARDLVTRLDADDRIDLWSPEEAAARRRTAAEALAGADGPPLAAAAEGGTATDAVAARQALHATAALEAVRPAGGDRGEEAGLDWLVHLDLDELFHLEGSDRGGATVAEHFAAAGRAGLRTVRYLNHELLLPSGGGADDPFRFKLNPVLAAARLGPVGWRRLVAALGMEQDGRRPYFRAYWNGKAAVAVRAGLAAGGVHRWRLRVEGRGPAEESEAATAGPSILHLHLATPESFRTKYSKVAEAATVPVERRAFPASPLEERVVDLVRRLRADGAGEGEIAEALDRVYRGELCATPDEVEMLEAAGLLLTPDVPAIGDRLTRS